MKLIVIFVTVCLVSERCGANSCPCDYEITLPLTRIGDKFYYIESNTKANWFKAMNFCNLHKMRLASITSEIENQDLQQHLAATGLNKTGFWTSGSDFAESGNWFWSSLGTRTIYFNWDQGKPDNTGGVEHCMEIYIKDQKLVWNDMSCGKWKYFICETWI